LEPWSITLGPFVTGADSTFPPAASTFLDGERMVFGVAALEARPAVPVELAGRPIVDGTDPVFIMGFVDEGGSAYEAWPLASSPGGPYPTIDLAPAGAGRAYVGVTAATGAEVHEIDLCTREETVVLRCEIGADGPQIDADAAGRLVIALRGQPGLQCSLLPADCTVPSGVGQEDTVIWSVDSGACSSILLHDPDEGASVPVSFQNGVTVFLLEEGVGAIGQYDGQLFTDRGTPIDTGEPYYYEDGPDPDADPDLSLGAFHTFLVRLAPDGGELEPIEAVDLGRIAFAVGSRGGLEQAGRLLVTTGVEPSMQPTGPWDDPPPPLVALGFIDALLGSFDGPLGSPALLETAGGGSADVPFGLHASGGGIALSGWICSQGGTLGTCSDGFVVNGNGGFIGGGCATFVPVGADGSLGSPYVVDAAEEGMGDFGLASFEIPGGGTFLLGSTGGTVALDRVIPAPPPGAVQLYLARR
jgi:hypothetical protein